MRCVRIIAIAIAGGLLVGNLDAGYTGPIGPPSGGEPSLNTIFNTLYGSGGSFTGLNWSNGTVTATRWEDFGAGGAYDASPDNHLVNGGGKDQIWRDGRSTFLGRVRFAGYSQAFGIDYGANVAAGPNGAIGGLDTQLLNVNGQGYDVFNQLSGTLTASYTFAPGSRWGWYRRGTTTNFSLASANPDSTPADHMITYQITGLTGPQYAGKTVWFLFWDDQTNPPTDRDFNDLGIELTAIPAPGAALLGVLGWGLVSAIRRRMA